MLNLDVNFDVVTFVVLTVVSCFLSRENAALAAQSRKAKTRSSPSPLPLSPPLRVGESIDKLDVKLASKLLALLSVHVLPLFSV